MKGTQQIRESWAAMRDNMPFLAVGRAQADAMLQAQTDVVEHLEEMQHAWLANAKQAAESISDLAARCAKCSNPGEVASLYSEWLNKRMEAFLADGRRLSDQWMRLFDVAFAPLKAAQGAAEQAAGKTEAGAEEAAAETDKRSRAAGA